MPVFIFPFLLFIFIAQYATPLSLFFPEQKKKERKEKTRIDEGKNAALNFKCSQTGEKRRKREKTAKKKEEKGREQEPVYCTKIRKGLKGRKKYKFFPHTYIHINTCNFAYEKYEI